MGLPLRLFSACRHVAVRAEKPRGNAASDAARESVEGEQEGLYAIRDEFRAQAARFAIVMGVHGILLSWLLTAPLYGGRMYLLNELF
jgi:hypothetical protein